MKRTAIKINGYEIAARLENAGLKHRLDGPNVDVSEIYRNGADTEWTYNALTAAQLRERNYQGDAAIADFLGALPTL
jgi:hypothetical protein